MVLGMSTKANMMSGDLPKHFSPTSKPNHSFTHTLFFRSLGSNWVSNAKNDHLLAFASIKNEWEVLRPSRLLWGIAMDLRMSAKTNDRCREGLENFLGPSEAHKLLTKRALFEAF